MTEVEVEEFPGDEVIEGEIGEELHEQPLPWDNALNSFPDGFAKWMRDGSRNTQKIKMGAVVGGFILALIAILLTIVIVAYLLGSGGTDINEATNISLLPTHIEAHKYDLSLKLDLDEFTFKGSVDFEFERTGDSFKNDYIILNSNELDIKEISVKGGDNKVSDWILRDEFLAIKFKKSLEEDEKYTISIDFTGTIKENMEGLYKSVYLDEDGEEHWLVSTQFESTYARQVFPCLDEPQYKAKFTIELEYKEEDDRISLSNMPEKDSSVKGGYRTVSYEESPKMSTYLVAFLVGEFGFVESEYEGKPVKVWSPLGHVEEGEFALDVAVDCLEFFENYFDIDYALPKLDLVAIPDFEAGAMENWGMLTFRLTALLFDPAEGSASNRQRVATVVSHEMAHQWTGNLVTTRFWSDLWLNEGFADFFETESINSIFPEWNLKDQFLVEDQQRAFGVDCLISTRSLVHHPVRTEGEISQMFDTITYSKGGSILRMIQGDQGEDDFQETISEYLTTYSYSNAVTSNFLDFFENFDYTGWTSQKGYPLITVVEDKKANSFTLTQERFIITSAEEEEPLGDEDEGEEQEQEEEEKKLDIWAKEVYDDEDYDPIDDEDNTWELLVSWTIGGDETSWEIMDEREATIVQKRSESGYLKLNIGQTGFYRVNYPESNWMELKDNADELSVADRAGLINDALVLASDELLDYSVALEFSEFLKDELAYTVWASGLSQLGYIGDMIETEYSFSQYQNFMQNILQTVTDYVGFDTLTEEHDYDHQKSLLRSSVLSYGVWYEVPSVVDQALAIWNDYKTNGTVISPEDRNAVYCAGLHYGNSEDYEFLLNHLMATTNAAEYTRVLMNLGCTREFHLLKYTLDISLDNDIVKPQDQRTVIAGVANNPLGRDLAWDFYQQNWESFNSPSGFIPYVTRMFNDEYHYKEVAEFFDTTEIPGSSANVQQSKERIRSNIKWMENNLEDIENWLDDNEYQS